MPFVSWPSSLLVLARVLPVSLVLASLTRGFVPREVALSLGLALAVALAPLAGTSLSAEGLVLAVALVRELCVGLVFALALGMALQASVWAVGMARPREARSPVFEPLATAYGLCAAWLVVSLGGLRALVIGLGESFRDAGLGAARLDARAFALGVGQLAADAFATALGFGLPLVLALWLLDVGLALVARVIAPRTGASAAIGALGPLLALAAGALLLAPIVARSPVAVRAAIEAARALTRAFAR